MNNEMNIEELVSQLSLEEKVRLCMDESNTMATAPITERGIPKLVMTDGTNGVRMTIFPVPDPKTLNFMDGINYNFDSPEALENTALATCFPAGSSLAWSCACKGMQNSWSWNAVGSRSEYEKKPHGWKRL